MKDEELAEEYLQSIEGDDCVIITDREERKQAFLAGLKASKSQWHKLSEKYPEVDKLIRVRLYDGMERICETCYYEPTEDEIGYGKLIISFYELNGEWVDDNDVVAWCEIPQYKE